MRISDVLRVEGTQVVTVTPDTKVRRLLAVLAEHRIGAVVSLTTAPRSTG
jgi:CBS domain-containing protein